MNDMLNDSAPDQQGETTIDAVIQDALNKLDGVILTPAQADEVLSYRLHIIASLLDDNNLEPEDFLTDVEFALSEIAHGEADQSFGRIYRKHRIISKDQALIGGVKETSLAADFTTGSIWSSIYMWKKSNDMY